MPTAGRPGRTAGRVTDLDRNQTIADYSEDYTRTLYPLHQNPKCPEGNVPMSGRTSKLSITSDTALPGPGLRHRPVPGCHCLCRWDHAIGLFLGYYPRWLGPMLFLSGLALTVSLRWGNLPGTVVPLMAWAGYVFLSIPSAPWYLSLLLASRAAGLLLTISGLGPIVYGARCAARWGLVVRWD